MPQEQESVSKIVRQEAVFGERSVEQEMGVILADDQRESSRAEAKKMEMDNNDK